MAGFGVHRLTSMEQRNFFIERANDIDDLLLSIYEKDMRLLQRLLRAEDTRITTTSQSKWKRQGVFIKLEEDLDDSFDSDNFRSALKESRLKRSLYVKRASIKKRFEVARMCHAQFRGLVEDRGYPLYPTGGENAQALPRMQPPKKCTDVNRMEEHMDLVISFMDAQLKMFLTDVIHNLELIRDEINRAINEFYRRLETGELTLQENANKRQIYSKLESFEGDKISIELSLSFFRECYMKIDADAMKSLGGRLMSIENDVSSAMERSDDGDACENFEEREEDNDDEESERMNIDSTIVEDSVCAPILSRDRPNKIEVHRVDEAAKDKIRDHAVSSRRANRQSDALEANVDAPRDRNLHRLPKTDHRRRRLDHSDSAEVYDDDSLRNIQRAIDEARAQKASRPRGERARYANTNDFGWDWGARRPPFGANYFGTKY